MKKFIFTVILSGTLIVQLYAQTDIDALRYSKLMLGGTSRFMAVGGAFGAVGADFSTLGINPAGIAIYKKSELTFTPSIYTSKTKSDFYGQSLNDGRTNFNLGNAGWVFTFNTRDNSDKPGWNNTNFAFGFNKYNNFNNRISIQGLNNKSSLMTDYIATAEGKLPKNLDSYTTLLAFNTDLLDTVLKNPTHYVSAVPVTGGISQCKTIETSGAINEMIFSFGGNYSDKLYLGGTVGIPYIKYHESASYTEQDNADTIPNFKSFTLDDDISTTGAGFNFKFGMIYRITDWVRIGVAAHTPTLFNLHDSYNRTITAYYDNGKNYSYETHETKFDYTITTPMRAIASIAFLINKMGFVSADYEFVDYSEARLNSSEYKFNDANKAVQNKYTTANNIRVGTEWNLYPIILRGGYSRYGSPYKSGINDGKASTFSAGIGLREDKYFLDISYIYCMMSEDYYLYNPLLIKPAKNNLTSYTLLLTFGIKY